MTQPIPNELWLAAPKDASWWMGVHPPDDPDDCINECPGHGPGTEDEPDFCDGSCVERNAT